MSTILKALRRLEEEKAATAEGRPLREEVAGGPRGERPRSRTGLTFALALLLGLGTGGSALWWLQRGPATEPAVAVAPAEPVAPTPAVPAPPASTRPPVELAQQAVPLVGETAEPEVGTGLPDGAFASDVEIVARPEAAPRLSDASPLEPSARPKPGSRRPVESSSAAARARAATLALAEAQRGASSVAPPPEPAPAPPPEVAVAPAEPAPAPSAPAPTPAVPPRTARTVAPPEPRPAPQPPAPAAPVARPVAPEPVRTAAAPRPEPAPPAALPELAIERTQWHPLPERRTAWLRFPGEDAARRVVEGDVVEGLRIEEIEPSGVVFERDGEKLRRGLGGP